MLEEKLMQEETTMSKIRWHKGPFVFLFSNQLVHLGASTIQVMGNVRIITSFAFNWKNYLIHIQKCLCNIFIN